MHETTPRTTTPGIYIRRSLSIIIMEQVGILDMDYRPPTVLAFAVGQRPLPISVSVCGPPHFNSRPARYFTGTQYFVHVKCDLPYTLNMQIPEQALPVPCLSVTPTIPYPPSYASNIETRQNILNTGPYPHAPISNRIVLPCTGTSKQHVVQCCLCALYSIADAVHLLVVTLHGFQTSSELLEEWRKVCIRIINHERID